MFLGDKSGRHPVTFTLNAIIASLSIGFASIYVSNFVGVYI